MRFTLYLHRYSVTFAQIGDPEKGLFFLVS
jgi:hypothetical protein